MSLRLRLTIAVTALLALPPISRAQGRLVIDQFRFDAGWYEEFTHIHPTNRALSERLTELRIPHVYEEYNGDHRNRLWGPEGRIATEVLPYFSRLLDPE